MHSARWLGPQRPLWRPEKSLFPISRRTRSPCCLAGLAKGTTRAEAMDTGLGRSHSKRAETKVSKAAGSSFQLETVRARCHLQVVLSVVVGRRFPTCPSISSGAPLEGLGSNPGVDDLPLGPGDHRRHRQRRHRRCRRRTVAPQCDLCWGPFGGACVGSLAGSHVLCFGSQTLILGAFAAYGGCRDRWTHFQRV